MLEMFNKICRGFAYIFILVFITFLDFYAAAMTLLFPFELIYGGIGNAPVVVFVPSFILAMILWPMIFWGFVSIAKKRL